MSVPVELVVVPAADSEKENQRVAMAKQVAVALLLWVLPLQIGVWAALVEPVWAGKSWRCLCHELDCPRASPD